MRRILTISVLRSCWRAARAPATTLRAPRARLRRPPGELEASFDAGGRKLHLLAGQVRVCTYDRLNVGRSDRATGRHTGADSVRDLHALLDAAAVPEPYLLVGFSFGGLLAIMYAATYPDQVMGMVSLDGSLPTDDQVDQLIPRDEREQVMAEQDRNQEQVQFTKTVPNGRLAEVQSSHDIDLDKPELVRQEVQRILDTA